MKRDLFNFKSDPKRQISLICRTSDIELIATEFFLRPCSCFSVSILHTKSCHWSIESFSQKIPNKNKEFITIFVALFIHHTQVSAASLGMSHQYSKLPRRLFTDHFFVYFYFIYL